MEVLSLSFSAVAVERSVAGIVDPPQTAPDMVTIGRSAVAAVLLLALAAWQSAADLLPHMWDC